MKTFEEWFINDTNLCGSKKSLAKLAFEAGQRSVGHCSCTMSQKMTGDGCSVCNPTIKREIDAYNEGYADGQRSRDEESHALFLSWQQMQTQADMLLARVHELEKEIKLYKETELFNPPVTCSDNCNLVIGIERVTALRCAEIAESYRHYGLPSGSIGDMYKNGITNAIKEEFKL